MRNSHRRDSVIRGDTSACFTAKTTRLNYEIVRIGYLRFWISVSAIATPIGNISFRSVPAKIGKNIVVFVIVIVTTLHTCRTRANKGFQNKTV